MTPLLRRSLVASVRLGQRLSAMVLLAERLQVRRIEASAALGSVDDVISDDGRTPAHPAVRLTE